MPVFSITMPKGTRTKTVEEKIKSLFPETNLSVKREDPPESRSDRANLAISFVEDAMATIEELKEELESWKDSIPENLQNSDKYSQLEESISTMENVINSLSESIDGISEIEFPSMMG